jgi:hypothetical protein
VDIAWSAGRLTELSVEGDGPARYVIRYGERSVEVDLAAGERRTWDGGLVAAPGRAATRP